MEQTQKKVSIPLRIALVILAAFLSLLLVSYIVSGDSFAWVHRLTGLFSEQGNAGHIGITPFGVPLSNQSDQLIFDIDPAALGAPGAKVEITTGNKVFPLAEDENTIYQIRYWTDEESIPYIESLELKEAVVKDLNLLKEEAGDKSVLYYGRFSQNEVVDLKELLLTYKGNVPLAMGQEIQLHAEVIYCQNSSAAFQDIFEKTDDEMAKYQSLFTT